MDFNLSLWILELIKKKKLLHCYKVHAADVIAS